MKTGSFNIGRKAAYLLVTLLFANNAFPADIKMTNAGETKNGEDSAAIGKKMQEEINSFYFFGFSHKNPVDSKKAVTNIVEKYIPVGTSFNAAKDILRAAGCKITTLNGGNTEPHETLSGKDDIVAIGEVRNLSFLTTNFVITLSPRAPGDYSIIAKVQAGIIESNI